MSGVHRVEQTLEGVNCHTLHHPSMLALLREYLALLQGLLGPKAGTLLIQHSAGLHSFVNSSSELIKKIQVHHPCLKFINSLIEIQELSYGCFGLYVGILCLSLLIELLILEREGVSQKNISDFADTVFAELLSQLENKNSIHVDKLDVSSLPQVMSLARTSLCSKNIGLSNDEIDHLCASIVQAFLQSISPDEATVNDFGDIVVVVQEGRPTTEACVYPGLLCRETEPNFSLIEQINLKFKLNNLQYKKKEPLIVNNYSTKNSLRKYSRHLAEEDYEADVEKRGTIRIILFNVPLVFEQLETANLTYIGDLSNKEIFDNLASSKLKALVSRENIDVVACQKVISPVIQWELEKCGVLVIERLGTSATEALRKLSACDLISDITVLLRDGEGSSNDIYDPTLQRNTDDDTASLHHSFSVYIGDLTSIKVVEIEAKSYLQLENVRQQSVNEIFNRASESDSFQHCKKYSETTIGRQEKEESETIAQGATQCVKKSLNGCEEKFTYTEWSSLGDLQRKECPVVSLLLPVLLPVMADRLKVLVQGALGTLRRACVEPWVCGGGGCLEVWLATLATSPTTPTPPNLVTSTKAQCLQVRAAIAKTFAKLGTSLSGCGSSKRSSFDYHFLPLAGHLFEVCADGSLQQSVPDKTTEVAGLTSVGSDGHDNEHTYVSVMSNDVSNPRTSAQPRINDTEGADKPTEMMRCSCGCIQATDKASLVPVRELVDVLHLSLATSTFSTQPLASTNVLGSQPSFKSPNQNFKASDALLVENFSAKLNAVRSAFEGTMQLFSINYCVFDR